MGLDVYAEALEATLTLRRGGLDWGSRMNSAKDADMNLQQLSELLQAQPGIPHDATHREGVDWVVAGNRQDSASIRHHNMRALAKHAKPCFLQRGHGSQMVDSRQFGHDSPQQC